MRLTSSADISPWLVVGLVAAIIVLLAVIVLQWTQRDASVSPGAAGGHRGALAHGRSGGPVLGR